MCYGLKRVWNQGRIGGRYEEDLALPAKLSHRLGSVFGRPACSLLTGCRRIAARTNGPLPPLPPRRILFLKVGQPAGLLLATDAVWAAIERVGRKNVYALLCGDDRTLIDTLGLVPADNILFVRTNNPAFFTVDLVRALSDIRRLKIDATVDLEFFSRSSAIIGFLTGARLRSGHHAFNSEGPPRGDLLTHRVEYDPSLHTATAYEILVETLFMDPGDFPRLEGIGDGVTLGAPPKFFPSDEDIARAQSLITGCVGRRIPRPIVTLMPSPADPLPMRKWAASNFILLGHRILESYRHAFIVVTGYEKEETALTDLTEAISDKKAVCVASNRTLRDLITLFSLSSIIIANHSTAVHLASRTDADTVVLFGPEDAKLRTPVGNGVHVISADVECSPCITTPNQKPPRCKKSECMGAISATRVFDEVAAILKQRGDDEPKF